MGDAVRGCAECDGLLESPEQGRIIFDVRNDLLGNAAENKIQEFVKAMNALLNEGSGTVIIHAEQPHQLGLFDEKIDEKLKRLIPDDSFYHENFKRHFRDDNHIVFRVLPRERPLSTVSFNSKVSLNKGRDEPTHAQMKRLVKLCSGPEPNTDLTFEDQRAVIQPFFVGEVVKVTPGIFQEGVDVQVKSVPTRVWNIRSEGRSTHTLINYCWQFIPTYTTAFNKLPCGGSIYFGIAEEKTGVLKWSAVEDVPSHVQEWYQSCDNEYLMWKNRGMFHIAKESQVPRDNERKTGGFICEGIWLTDTERESFQRGILQKICKKMLWLARSPFDSVPVCVNFHSVTTPEVRGSSKLFVVEIVVRKIHGISFYDEQGPDAYELPQASRSPRRIKTDQWVQSNGGTISKQTLETIPSRQSSSGASARKKRKLESKCDSPYS